MYLLRELSRQFPELWIKVNDTDGEFLLIEAANALPQWLNPEVADNRVWINNSHLKIIPLTASAPTPAPSGLTQPEALKIIKEKPDAVAWDEKMETEAFYRLRNYPSQINDSLHHALVTIPRNLAYILHEIPAIIAPAVEAFYLRDPIGLKPLQTDLTGSTLTFAPTDLVTTSVRFTKVLYAQVKSQQFEPLPSWRALLTSAEKSATIEAGKKDLDRLEIGMKLTVGFNHLLTDGIKRDNRSVREMQILLQDLSEGEPLPSDRQMDGWKDAKREDSEAWLDINFEDFEKELAGKKKTAPSASNSKPTFGPERPPAASNGKGKEKAAPSSGFGDAKTATDLKKMVERFESFLANDSAGIDGAELSADDVDNDSDSNASDLSEGAKERGDRPEWEDSPDELSDDEGAAGAPQLDPKEFARMMRQVMGVSMEGMGEVPLFDPATGSAPKALRGPMAARHKSNNGQIEELSSDDEAENEGAKFKKMMDAMDAELRTAGALSLDDPAPSPPKSTSKPPPLKTQVPFRAASASYALNTPSPSTTPRKPDLRRMATTTDRSSSSISPSRKASKTYGGLGSLSIPNTMPRERGISSGSPIPRARGPALPGVRERGISGGGPIPRARQPSLSPLRGVPSPEQSPSPSARRYRQVSGLGPGDASPMRSGSPLRDGRSGSPLRSAQGSLSRRGKGLDMMGGIESGSEDEDREMDIDYNLAKNLLESFKGQAGMPGPGGNLMGMMGVQLPRDEDEGEEKLVIRKKR